MSLRLETIDALRTAASLAKRGVIPAAGTVVWFERLARSHANTHATDKDLRQYRGVAMQMVFGQYEAAQAQADRLLATSEDYDYAIVHCDADDRRLPYGRRHEARLFHLIRYKRPY